LTLLGIEVDYSCWSSRICISIRAPKPPWLYPVFLSQGLLLRMLLPGGAMGVAGGIPGRVDGWVDPVITGGRSRQESKEFGEHTPLGGRVLRRTVGMALGKTP
jgi:hypothetical protein